MTPIRCLLVDDEELALDILEMYIGNFKELEVSCRCTDTIEATDFLQHNVVDLVFLDIQMPKMTGMEWIKRLTNSPKIIFCTAYDHFALESYEVEAVDYLLKPFSFERFEKAVSKAKETIIKEQLLAEIPSNDKFFLVKSEGKILKIKMTDILYFHSLSNYYRIVTIGKKIIAYGSISTLERELSPSQFIRIHRSYLVARDKIEAFSSNAVFIHGETLPVGRNYRNNVECQLGH
jgi:DNA-binding LytR/AlgR family response regulator